MTAIPGYRFSIHRVLLCLTLIFAITGGIPAKSDEIRPALLNITETSPGWFDVLWKFPTKGELAVPLDPVLPDTLHLIGSPTIQKIPGAIIQRATYQGDASEVTGKTVTVDGLSDLQSTDVLLQVELLDGRAWSVVLRPGNPEFTLPKDASGYGVALSYWRLGVTHILSGFDHLLFVLALLLIIDGLRPLVKAITAFTIAHSITLVLASLGKIGIPPAPTEAIIALSIVFLASEILRHKNDNTNLTTRYPWMVAFGFGLFHGLGFAGALAEIGLPQQHVPVALLMFNIGVETGQIMFVVLVTFLIWASRLILSAKTNNGWRTATSYLIGSIAMYWTIERITGFLGTGFGI